MNDSATPTSSRKSPSTATAGPDWSINGHSLAGLAERFGTPLIAYDEESLRLRCWELAFPDGVSYASKGVPLRRGGCTPGLIRSPTELLMSAVRSAIRAMRLGASSSLNQADPRSALPGNRSRGRNG